MDDTQKLEQILNPFRHISDYNFENLTSVQLPTGFPSLDRLELLKEDEGQLVIVGARPGVGKTVMLLQLAYNLSISGRVLFFSLEMGHKQVLRRLVSMTTNIPMDYLASGSADKQRLDAAQKIIAKIPLEIDDAESHTANEICNLVYTAHKQAPVKAVVIDYLQRVKASDAQGRHIALGDVGKQFKSMAKTIGCPFIVGAQLNRSMFSDKDALPRKEHIAESDQIERHADIIMLLHRNKESPTQAQIIIAKNRDGRTGDVLLEFSGRTSKFLDRPGA